MVIPGELVVIVDIPFTFVFYSVLMSNNPTNPPPTRKFIRNALQYGLLSGDDLEKSSWKGRSSGSINSDAANLVGRNKGRFVRRFVKIAYENRERIKSIPILSSIALYIKDRLMKHGNNMVNRAALDFSSILGMGEDEFIQNLYMSALGRSPDVEGYNNAKQALLLGLPREGLIFLICTSAEFANRAPVKHLKDYRRIYRYHTLRRWIKRVPIFGLSIQFSDMERQVASLSTAMETANQNITYAILKIDALNAKVDQVATMLTQPVFYSIPGGITVLQMEKFIFGIPSDEWRLAKYLSQGGTFELGTENFFCSIIEKDMIVLDIGAYLGIYTLHALTAGCIVYSYEPTPQIFKILSDNIGINGFEPTGRAHVYNLIVSDIEGEVDFNLFSSGQNNSIFNREEEGGKIKLQSVCLDTQLSHLDHVDVVKIDVEGAEPLVLHGMKKIISKNPGIRIIMEFAPSNLKRGGIDPSNFINSIHAMGLDIQVIDEGSGKVLDISKEELCKAFSVNLLLRRNTAGM